MVGSKPEVVRNFTWAIWVKDVNFWHLGGATRMELPIFNTNMNFFSHHFYCFTIAPLFGLDKSTAWNRCLQHPCFKNLCKIAQASKNSDSNAQHFLSDLLTHSWFYSMLFALPGYQFPYVVMNICFHLMPKFTSSLPLEDGLDANFGIPRNIGHPQFVM